MSESIINSIESVSNQLSEQAGTLQGAKLDPTEAVRVNYGSDLLSLAYAGLFFPTIAISNGIPIARFATAVSGHPLDCFHIDLLHHHETHDTSPDVYAAIGHTLAEAWTHALKRQGLSGRFAYDSSTGFDVIYEP